MSEIIGPTLGSVIAGKIIAGTALKVENLDVPISQLKASLDIISAASSKIGNLDTPISQLKTSLDNISAVSPKLENLDIPISQLKASLDSISAVSPKLENLDTPISQLKTSLDNISGKADTTNATLLEVKSLLEDTVTTGRLFISRPDVTVDSTEAFFISSGSEAAFKNLTIDGEVRVDGKLIAKSIVVNGVLKANGVVELD